MYVPLYVPLRADPGGCELVRVSVIEPEVTVCANEMVIDVALTTAEKLIGPPSGGMRVPFRVPPETFPLTGSVGVNVCRGVLCRRPCRSGY